MPNFTRAAGPLMVAIRRAKHGRLLGNHARTLADAESVGSYPWTSLPATPGP